jgi:hypothetical protein
MQAIARAGRARQRKRLFRLSPPDARRSAPPASAQPGPNGTQSPGAGRRTRIARKIIGSEAETQARPIVGGFDPRQTGGASSWLGLCISNRRGISRAPKFAAFRTPPPRAGPGRAPIFALRSSGFCRRVLGRKCAGGTILSGPPSFFGRPSSSAGRNRFYCAELRPGVIAKKASAG